MSIRFDGVITLLKAFRMNTKCLSTFKKGLRLSLFRGFNKRFAEQRHGAGRRMCHTGGSGEGRLFLGVALGPKSRLVARPTPNRRHCGAGERGAVWRKWSE